MLQVLKLKNLAIVRSAEIEFSPGYNVITGETGAGKSILIDGLMLVLGERAERGVIRTGAEECVIEAVFDFSKASEEVRKFLEDRGISADDPVAVRRLLSARVTSKQTINGSLVNLSVLRELGRLVVDFHGPYEHQSLLDPGVQLLLLDRYGNLDSLRKRFSSLVQQYQDLKSRKRDLVQDERIYLQQLDYLRHQVEEIEKANVRPKEDEEIERAYNQARYAARISELGWEVTRLLGSEEGGVLATLSRVGRILREIKGLDQSATGLVEDHGILMEQLSEFIRQLERYLEGVQFDPARFAALEERYNLLNLLKKKYGPTLENVLESLEGARKRLWELESREERLKELEQKLAELRCEIQRVGLELAKARKSIIPKLVEEVTNELQHLGFKHCKFDVRFESKSVVENDEGFSSTGFDIIEFMFSANPGEEPRSLRHVASSGELARVMLSLKTVLAACDQVPILVFDEVDANIGGETGLEVGRRLRELSRRHQVICITHLPQVAAFAERHFVVSKMIHGNQTEAVIELADDAKRVSELARMLGGQTETARKHARALLRLQ
jgi:DNA repair protein RecN (Recombination protein N)